jgi:hypothetical protein
MSLIVDNFPKKVNSIIALLNYHNCLYYNHTEFGLSYFDSYETWLHEKQNKHNKLMERIYGILIQNYNFNNNIDVNFIGLDRVYIDVDNFNVNFIELDRVYIDVDNFNKECEIIDFANQDLINMVYEIARWNRIKKELIFALIYNLLLR